MRWLLGIMLGLCWAFPARGAEQLFAAQSPWNRPIEQAERQASFGGEALAAFRATGGSLNLNRSLWTTTFAIADADTPRFDVAWDKWLLRDVPVPSSVLPTLDALTARGDTDRLLCVLDPGRGKAYSFWKAARPSDGLGGLRVQAGGAVSMAGSGWWDNSKEPWAGSASGRSSCAGVIRRAEVEAGEIPHALSAGWPRGLLLSSRAPGGGVVFPARTTDGVVIEPMRGLPMGTRLQLDPSLREAQLLAMGLQQADLPIARAMQKYGVYIVDSANAFSIHFESDLGQGSYEGLSNPWPATLMGSISVTQPPRPQHTAPIESRLTNGEPVVAPPGWGRP